MSLAKKKHNGNPWPVRFIIVMRGLTVGLAYIFVIDMPGLTSSFVAIFVALLAFDLIVAMPKFSFKLKHWKNLITMLLPRISGTTITLARGLIIGAVFGLLAQLGLPIFIGGVLTIGLAYQFAEGIKGNISHYVSMLSGLTLYDQIIRIPQFSPNLLTDIGGTVLQVVYGTFTALFVGWLCGVAIGIPSRLMLPRGYRTTLSSAYELPLSLQPMQSVLHTNEDMSLVRITVSPSSALAFKQLQESGLRENYQATVLSIYRREKDVVAPNGQEHILPGDVLVMVMPTAHSADVFKLVRGSDTQNEQV